MAKMTGIQLALTELAKGKPGPFRVGWYASHGEPYHVEGCRYWPQVRGHNTHGFPSQEAAEAAGHPPAKCCAAKLEREEAEALGERAKQRIADAVKAERNRIADWVAARCRCIDAYKQIGRIDPECQACDLAAEIREGE